MESRFKNTLDDFWNAEPGDVYVVLDLGMTGIAISWFLADELPAQEAEIKSQHWPHWVTNWPERGPSDGKFSQQVKVPARLAIKEEGGSPTFGFQIDNSTVPESIMEHFKQRFRDSPKHEEAYHELLCSVFRHAFTDISKATAHPNPLLKLCMTGPEGKGVEKREAHYNLVKNALNSTQSLIGIRTQLIVT